MRWCVALALISTLLSSNALAAGKGGKKKNPKNDKPAASMETTGTDPTKTEKSDPGPYAPKGATGELAEKAKETEEVAEVVKARPRDKAVLFGDLAVGFGNAPKPGPADDDKLRGSISASLIIGGRFDLSPAFSLGFRAPISFAAIDRPSINNANNGKEGNVATGAVELLGEYRVSLSPVTSLPVLFGLGVPTASGDPDISTGDNKNRTNMVVDASRGWRDGELFWPKRIPLILGLGIRHEGRKLEVHAATKVVAGIKISGGVLVPKYYGAIGELEVNGLALRNVTDVGLTYAFGEKFWAGADVWMVYNIIEPMKFTSDAEPPFPLQFVAEPKVGLNFGKIRPSLGFIFPLGGRLADPAIYAAHLRVDVAF
jgi:hypothetical protein